MNDGTLLFVNLAVYSWLLLMPIVAVEARELGKCRLYVSTGRLVAAAAIANTASTFLCTGVLFGAGWILGWLDVVAEPQAAEGDIAALFALVPCFFLSVWADTLVGGAVLKSAPRELVRAAFLRANLLSYAMIGIVPVVRFVKSAVVNGRIIW